MRKLEPELALAAADLLALPGPELVAKDLALVDALAAILRAALPEGVRLVFAGGTCLARAHKIVRRMSEDMDLKVDVPAHLSKSARRTLLGKVRYALGEELRSEGFNILGGEPLSGNDNRFIEFHLAGYAGGAGGVLRDHIMVQVVHCPLRHPSVRAPLGSLYHEATGNPPEMASVECISVLETGAEKLIALTRRIAWDQERVAGNARDRFVVRHLYDLHWILRREEIHRGALVELAKRIMLSDAGQFGNQCPGYRNDPIAWTARALERLLSDPVYRRDYADFLDGMVYGEHTPFDAALESVAPLARELSLPPLQNSPVP